MQRKFRGIILNLFDGDGAGAAQSGGTGGGDGASTGGGEISAEAQARGRELGVPEDLMEDYQRAFYSGRGSDSASGTEKEQNNEEAGQEEDADTAFDKLIKGEYKGPWQKRTQALIKERVQKANSERAALEGEMADFKEFAKLLGQKYGTEDPKALMSAIRADEDMWRQPAIDSGQTAAEYLNSYDKQQEAQRQEEELQALRAEKQMNELNSRLQGLAQKTREQYPDFDLEAEMQNPKFRAALDFAAAQNEQQHKAAGTQGEVFDLTYAYELAHADELRDNQIKRVSKATASAVAQTIQANRARVPENAGRGAAPGRMKSYRDMSDEEFEAHLEKVKRGEAHI